MSNINGLKEYINYWFAQNSDKCLSGLLELEYQLSSLKRDHGITINIDTRIDSLRIRREIKTGKFGKPYESKDYVFNLLHWLSVHYPSDKSLVYFIDIFCIYYKEQLGINDIQQTSTGATRCKTNMRFAIKLLRETGLVLDADKLLKRTWCPSIYGLLILLGYYYRPNQSKLSSDHKEIQKDFDFSQSVNIIGLLDFNTLYSHVLGLQRNPDDFTSHLLSQSMLSISKDESRILQDLVSQYFDFVSGTLRVTANGVEHTSEYREKSKKFQKSLTFAQTKYSDLHLKLLNHYQHVCEREKYPRYDES